MGFNEKKFLVKNFQTDFLGYNIKKFVLAKIDSFER
jgi:hypothetical protein